MTEESSCHQPCPIAREGCGHQCGAPCHAGTVCPNVPCKAEVVLKCGCGYRTEKSQCLVGGEERINGSDYQK